MDSILDTIKKMLGVGTDDTSFDVDITVHINSVLAILSQVGIGSDEGFAIADSTDTWSSLFDSNKNLELIKSYIFTRVKIMFDPPSSSFVLEAMNRSILEFEYRLNLQSELNNPTVIEPDESEEEDE